MLITVVALTAFFIGAPMSARRGGLYSGSYQYARQWKEQLAQCNSLEDVKRRFNCIRLDWVTENRYEQVQISNVGRQKPSALLYTWPDGTWIACAYADSHGGPAGGTLVARDSKGTIRAFFGHICGKPVLTHDDSLAEIYGELADFLTEVSLEREQVIDANAPLAIN